MKRITSPDFILGIVAGFGAALGVSQIPGVVVTSEACRQAELARAGCEAAAVVLDENRVLAWEKYRECRESRP